MARSPALQPSAPLPLPLSSQVSTTSDAHYSHDGKDKAPVVKHGEEDPHSSFFSQVYEWLQHEKAKRNARKMKVTTLTDGTGDSDDCAPLERTVSQQSSESSVCLDKLDNILLQYAEKREAGPPTRRSTRRRHHVKGLRSGSFSESDHPDLDAAVPSVDASLDNTKTLAYSGGAADDEDDGDESSKRAKDKEHWLTFKRDILRIVHTLRLKGWRKIPMEDAGDVDVTRLSGALTNAVYVVAPPKNLPAPKNGNGSPMLIPRKPPPYVFPA